MITATKQLISTLPPKWHESFLERAAIMEYDGLIPRDQAERIALMEIQQKMLQSKKGYKSEI